MKRLFLVVLALCCLSLNIATQKKVSSWVSKPSKASTTKTTTLRKKTTSTAKKSSSLTQKEAEKNIEKCRQPALLAFTMLAASV